MDSEQHHLAIRLDNYLGRFRRREIIRLLSNCLVDLFLLALLLGSIGLLWVHWSLRGDLTFYGIAVIALSAAVPILLSLGRALKEQRNLLASARSLTLKNGLELTRQSGQQSPLHVHELLAAKQLAVGEQSERTDDPFKLSSSSELARLYIREVDEECAKLRLPPPIHSPFSTERRIILLCTLALALVLSFTPGLQQSLHLWLQAQDGRPPRSAEGLWSQLILEVDYPPHTHRPKSQIINPSGKISLPQYSEIHWNFELHDRNGTQPWLRFLPKSGSGKETTSSRFQWTKLRIHNSESEPKVDQKDASDPWSIVTTIHESGSWQLELGDASSPSEADRNRHSTSLSILVEKDRLPEAQLSLAQSPATVITDQSTIHLDFAANDDFGFSGAKLWLQYPEETPHQINLEPPSPGHMTLWKQSLAIDLSRFPSKDLDRLLLWVEVHDNDPAFAGKPNILHGKPAYSEKIEVNLLNERRRHELNLDHLQELQGQIIDGLAERLVLAFNQARSSPESQLREDDFLRAHLRLEQLLAFLLRIKDSITSDPYIQDYESALLGDIHTRLLSLYREEERSPVMRPPSGGPKQLSTMSPGRQKSRYRFFKLNENITQQLEDEAIRIDDLLNWQLVATLETTIANLEASQLKLVDLLQQLAAGDQSVRAAIQRLQERIAEDMHAVQYARQQLRKEKVDEFINKDAFEVMQSRIAHNTIGAQLDRGDLKGALQQAQEGAESVKDMRNALHDRMADDQQQPQASQEEQSRIYLLRALARAKDELSQAQEKSQQLEQSWRKGVEGLIYDANSDDLNEELARIQTKLRSINDARLGRAARRSLLKGQQWIRSLILTVESESPTTLEVHNGIRALLMELQIAEQGGTAKSPEVKALNQVIGTVESIRRRLKKAIPSPAKVASPEEQGVYLQLAKEAHEMALTMDALRDSSASQILPESGHRALQGASDLMIKSERQLKLNEAVEAGDLQDSTQKELQRAIDSLRPASSPPPQRASSPQSFDVERDLHLREKVLEAMENASEGNYGQPVEGYYKELLQ